MKFFCLAIFFLSRLIAAETLKLKVASQAAVVMNANTGMVLYAKNPHQLKYPADITKLATLLYALGKDREDLGEIVTCPRHCLKRIHLNTKKAHHFCDPAHWLEVGGSHYWVKPGEQLPFRALLYGMVLTSGHDAANCVAYHVGGTIPQFLKEMDDHLKKMGCKNTHFLNPHGLHHPKHVTTAYDMALIMKEVLRDKRAFDILSTKHYERPKTHLQNARLVHNKSPLTHTGTFFYPKALATKSGYHKNAHYTFVGVAQQEERVLIAVLMDCASAHQQYRDAIRLFEAAFSETKRVRRLFNRDESVFEQKIKKEKTPILASLDRDITICYYPSEEPTIRVELKWRKQGAPPQKGEYLGEVRILDEHHTLLETAPLYAMQGTKEKKNPLFTHEDGTNSLPAALVKSGLTLLFFSSTTSCVYYLFRRLKKKDTKDLGNR